LGAVAMEPGPHRRNGFGARSTCDSRVILARVRSKRPGESGACGVSRVYGPMAVRKNNRLGGGPGRASGAAGRRGRGPIVLLRFANGKAKPCATVNHRA